MNRFLILFIFSLLYAPNFSWAQPSDNIEDRVSSNEPIIIQSEDPLFIDKNLILLRKPKFWTAYAVPSLQYTDNVLLSQNNEEHDWISSITTGIDFNLRMQNDIGLNAGIAASKFYYHDNGSLDYDTLQGNVSASYALKNWLFSAGYNPAFVFDQDFNDRILTLHRFTGSASRSFQLWDKFILSPLAAANYVAANPDDFSYLQVDGGARLAYPINQNLVMSFAAQSYYKQYDDYFEDQTAGAERDDYGVRINAQINYKIKDNINFNANVGFTRNKSTLDIGNYDVKNITPTLQFTYKF